jgi:hypothetical protein
MERSDHQKNQIENLDHQKIRGRMLASSEHRFLNSHSDVLISEPILLKPFSPFTPFTHSMSDRADQSIDPSLDFLNLNVQSVGLLPDPQTFMSGLNILPIVLHDRPF